VREPHPAAFLVETQEMVAEFIGFRWPQFANASAAYPVFAHDLNLRTLRPVQHKPAHD
jgi:hypothetical protein